MTGVIFDYDCLRRRKVSSCTKCLRYEQCSKTMEPLKEIITKPKSGKTIPYGKVPTELKKKIYDDYKSGYFYNFEIAERYNITTATLTMIVKKFAAKK